VAAAQHSAQRRLETTRRALVESAGIKPDRLKSGATTLRASGDARVGFELTES
jgi:hypothetical protein